MASERSTGWRGTCAAAPREARRSGVTPGPWTPHALPLSHPVVVCGPRWQERPAALELPGAAGGQHYPAARTAMHDTNPTPTHSESTSNAWQSALTVLQEVAPPFIPDEAHAMTVVIEYP